MLCFPVSEFHSIFRELIAYKNILKILMLCTHGYLQSPRLIRIKFKFCTNDLLFRHVFFTLLVCLPLYKSNAEKLRRSKGFPGCMVHINVFSA